ncbi:thiamine pyrophosphate-requiring protein [Hydrogenophaga sp. BPS33]|uniref:thiamine pyrophosphate-requiring protein n=1 Tax=Hydrogenophaga sp. BPS33 TaxID=2651974 RepID=UPI00131F8A3F|nr:thiamine pyrophosphate-requiring protein [Hydrogenophaga sp. BPS33]QHE87319.1 thiamine pyrophosphate-requiring protein [Hydrogenophaga sp. BPS33]
MTPRPSPFLEPHHPRKITMQVMDVIAEMLKREGIDTMFCYPTTPVIEAAARAGIRPVLCRQERVGVDMANGYTRTRNGKPFSVFAMQYGPGAENAFSGVATAYSDSAPILLLPLGHRREVAQVPPTFRSSRTFSTVTRSAEELLEPHEIGNVMRRAFNHLKNGRLGPVMVELPMDLVEHELGDFPIVYQPVRATRSAADERDVDDAARLLLDARCPVIQAGQGILYAQAWDELRELAELTSIPVITTVEGKGAFPENHPLSLGTTGAVLTGHGHHFMGECDLLFGAGSSLTRHFLTNRVLPVSGRKVIQASNDPRDFYKGYEMDVALLGDAKLVLRQLVEAVRDRLNGKPRVNDTPHQIAKIKQSWLAEWAAKLTSNQTPMTPYRVVAEFSKVVDHDKTIVTHDSGSPRDQILPFYECTVPNGYLGWGKSHALGTGLGLTIGAKLAAPDRFCVNFMGDAAFGMTGLDFETSVRVDAPICTVVLNNSTMAIETRAMKLSHSIYRTRDIGGSYAALARDLGGWSEKVEDPSQIAAAFERAREQNENGRAALLEFVTNEETDFSFRRTHFSH